MKKIETVGKFVASLDDGQRAFFLERELAGETRLQSVLVELARSISGVSELHGQALSLRLSPPAPQGRSKSRA